MRSPRMVSAGLIDSGLASLATFGVGLYAARMLEAEVLGVYALFFSAFVMASAVAAKLFYIPAEAWVVSAYESGREVLFKQMLKVLPLTLVVSPLITGLAFLLVPEIATPEVIVGIAATTALCGIISPLQDHCRRTLHIASMSSAAALVSGVQLAGAILAMTILHGLGVGTEWIPFGALAIANVFSLATAYALSGFWRTVSHARLRVGHLLEAGRWLASASVISRGADLAGAAIIGALGGASALGFAEAARVVAQPVVVLGTGLSAVMSPKAMEAGARGDRAGANLVGRRFLWAIKLTTVAYLAVVTFNWIGNPFALLVPAAYDVPGLVAVTVIAGALAAASFVWASELVAVGRSSWILPTDTAAAGARLAAAVTAGVIGAFAAPLGVGLGGATRLLGYGRSRQRNYDWVHERPVQMKTAEFQEVLDP